ncbi:hypothetical protein [Dyella choica]|uniref:Uncharacterized protein n=1 Tax=Dyella choica TaxID=1927959 RepID=A0A3S0RKV0_9GAMM|nr:hypothetical protein [Dyella choica]RUL76090.1 hypothetical protein EKH80_10280 [Dyella choica]
MNRKKIEWFAAVLAWVLLPMTAYALPLYWYKYVPLRAGQAASADQIESVVHVLFRSGISVNRPRSVRDNIALDFYNDFSNSIEHGYFTPLYPTIQEAESEARFNAPLNGILMEVAPDERAFDLRRTIDNLESAIPNQDAERSKILRYLAAVLRHIPPRTLIAGMPLPSDDAPITPTIQGAHVRRAIIYLNDAVVREVTRNSQDPPFSEPSDTHLAQGYEFSASPVPFPVRGPVSTVAPGTDNLTFFGQCRALTRALSPSTGRDHRYSQQETCKSEMITLDEFSRRHARHQGVTAPLTLLL